MTAEFYERKDPKGAANYLVEESTKRWLEDEEVIDDISIIVIFFE